MRRGEIQVKIEIKEKSERVAQLAAFTIDNAYYMVDLIFCTIVFLFF